MHHVQVFILVLWANYSFLNVDSTHIRLFIIFNKLRCLKFVTS